MDQRDQKIIRELQRDGRATNLEIASKVHLSPSPCLRRIRLLEESGVIRGYRAVVDQKAYGLPVTVFIRIRLERHTAETVHTFENSVRAMDEVLECHLMTGQADYLLRVIVAGLESYEAFIRDRIHKIGGVASIESNFVYGSVKDTGIFPFI